MKKYLLLLVTFACLSGAQAQFGVRAGLNSANFNDDGRNAISGFNVQTYYLIDAGAISIEPGVQFSQKGYRDNDGVSGDLIKERLNYIDIPVLLRLTFIPGVNVFAGPQASALISRKFERPGETQTSTEPVRGYDLGGVVGVGFRLPTGINGQISYDIGFTNLNYFNQDLKNRVLKLSLGIDI